MVDNNNCISLRVGAEAENFNAPIIAF